MRYLWELRGISDCWFRLGGFDRIDKLLLQAAHTSDSALWQSCEIKDLLSPLQTFFFFFLWNDYNISIHESAVWFPQDVLVLCSELRWLCSGCVFESLALEPQFVEVFQLVACYKQTSLLPMMDLISCPFPKKGNVQINGTTLIHFLSLDVGF